MKSLVYHETLVNELTYHSRTGDCVCQPSVETQEFNRLGVIVYTVKHQPLTEDQKAGIKPKALKSISFVAPATI